MARQSSWTPTDKIDMLVAIRKAGLTSTNRTDLNVFIAKYLKAAKRKDFPWWVNKFRSARGQYDFSTDIPQAVKPSVSRPVSPVKAAYVAPINDEVASIPSSTMPAVMMSYSSLSTAMPYVPERHPGFIPFGAYGDLLAILKSRKFYPVFIAGLSGNGKTQMVEQACAVTKRELIRVSVTIETDEDDLLGGFRLVNGATVFQYGPVVEAARRGSVLLLDEVDFGGTKLLCLQAVLEGKPFLLKKTGEVIHPASGFQVIATANTKGRGAENTRYVGNQIMNEAFLERFPLTVNHDYPPMAVESKILKAFAEVQGIALTETFRGNLCTWSDYIRTAYKEGGAEDVISTRRLLHLVTAFGMFNDERKALEYTVRRFDDVTAETFIQYYDKVAVVAPEGAGTGIPVASNDPNAPF